MLFEPHKNPGSEAGQSYQVHVHTRKQAQGMARPNPLLPFQQSPQPLPKDLHHSDMDSHIPSSLPQNVPNFLF